MKESVNIRYGYYFPWQFRLVAALVVVGAFALSARNVVVASVFIGIALLVITAGEGTMINVANKTYQEYTSFLFFLKVGHDIKYESLDKIFINSSKVSQRVYTAHTLSSTIHSKRVYNAFLKLSDGEKIKLLANSDKDQLMRKLTPAAHTLGIRIEDHNAY